MHIWGREGVGGSYLFSSYPSCKLSGGLFLRTMTFGFDSIQEDSSLWGSRMMKQLSFLNWAGGSDSLDISKNRFQHHTGLDE